MIRVEALRIAGITRVRNEGHIIGSTLDHFSDFCNAGIFVFDDASTDNTLEICQNHRAVKGIIANDSWDESRNGRQAAEGIYRFQAFSQAMEKAKPDWVFCFDADERPELDLSELQEPIDFKVLSGIRLRLFDFYITPEDENLDWSKRTWIGPEYRDILMFFNAQMVRGFPDREPHLPIGYKVISHGFVRHYGKAISVRDWETKCEYYGEHLPEPYQSKWRSRKGRAIKKDYLSDFGNPLIKWEDRVERGIRLTSSLHAKEFSNGQLLP